MSLESILYVAGLVPLFVAFGYTLLPTPEARRMREANWREPGSVLLMDPTRSVLDQPSPTRQVPAWVQMVVFGWFILASTLATYLPMLIE